jgi:hypothetical protein
MPLVKLGALHGEDIHFIKLQETFFFNNSSRSEVLASREANTLGVYTRAHLTCPCSFSQIIITTVKTFIQVLVQPFQVLIVFSRKPVYGQHPKLYLKNSSNFVLTYLTFPFHATSACKKSNFPKVFYYRLNFHCQMIANRAA